MKRWLVNGVLAFTVFLLWVLLAAYGAVYGWWMSPVADHGDVDGFSAWAKKQINERNAGNSAFVLIVDGRVAFEHYATRARGVNEDTLFATASLSKLPAALAVMTLVERGQIDLDAPIGKYLTRWQLPSSDFAPAEVTIRRLLSHTAGLTDGLGFGDYTAEEEVPALVASLNAPRTGRGDTASIRVGITPGSEFQYSGGGYLILELLIEEVTGQTFADYVATSLYRPLAMTRTNYDFVGEQSNASASFHRDGSPAPAYQYASAAATGLITSARDLTRLAAFLGGTEPGPVGRETLQIMREPNANLFGAPVWGLGVKLYAESGSGDFVFGHDGGNEPAINSSLRVNPYNGDAFILLVNGHPSLASEVGGEWVLWQTGQPDFLSINRALQSAVLPILLGGLVIVFVFIWRTRRPKSDPFDDEAT